MSSIHLLASSALGRPLREFADMLQSVSDTVWVCEFCSGKQAEEWLNEGRHFDIVVFADEIMDSLVKAQHVSSVGLSPLIASPVAGAVRQGDPLPDLSSEDSARGAILAARKIAYSSGPSGKRLLQLMDRWGLTDHIHRYGVAAPAGVPVASLLSSGEADLGFQQQSELLNMPGVTVAGLMQPYQELLTVFEAGLSLTTASEHKAAFEAFCHLAKSPEGEKILRAGGLELMTAR